jgi:hypothetical protein
MAASRPASRDVVIAIGVDRLPGVPHLPVLRYAEADARLIARTFGELGVPRHRIHLLTGADATFDAVGRRLAGIPRDHPDLGPGDRVWFCFSGHGVTSEEDGRTHLLVHDTATDAHGMPWSSVTVEQVVNVLPDATRADRVLVLDACRQGVGPRSRSGRIDLAGIPGELRSGLAVFSGCGEGDISFESPGRRLGVFTAAFADVLISADRPATVEELEYRLLSAVTEASMALGPTYYQRPSLRTEPHWQASAMLLLPHLLDAADIQRLREDAVELPEPASTALWRALDRLESEGAGKPGVRGGSSASGSGGSGHGDEGRSGAAAFGEAGGGEDGQSDRSSGGRSGAGSRGGDEGGPSAPSRTVPGRTRRGARGTVRSATTLELRPLRDALRGVRWEEADRESARLLMRAAGADPDRVGNLMIRPEQAPLLRHADLAAIDELWMRYSDGRFGFTPQLRRLHNARGDIAHFADLVGWRDGRWILYAEAQWSSAAPPGHLPILGPVGGVAPPWRMSYGRQLAAPWQLAGGVAYRALGYHRDRSAMARATADIPVDETFGWPAYNRLAAITMADVLASAARGRLRPLAAVYQEAPLRRLATSYTSLLSVVWCTTRVPLLHHYASA